MKIERVVVEWCEVNIFEVVLLENVINDVWSGKFIEIRQLTGMIELEWCVLHLIKTVQCESERESTSANVWWMAAVDVDWMGYCNDIIQNVSCNTAELFYFLYMHFDVWLRHFACVCSVFCLCSSCKVSQSAGDWLKTVFNLASQLTVIHINGWSNQSWFVSDIMMPLLSSVQQWTYYLNI